MLESAKHFSEENPNNKSFPFVFPHYETKHHVNCEFESPLQTTSELPLSNQQPTKYISQQSPNRIISISSDNRQASISSDNCQASQSSSNIYVTSLKCLKSSNTAPTILLPQGANLSSVSSSTVNSRSLLLPRIKTSCQASKATSFSSSSTTPFLLKTIQSSPCSTINSTLLLRTPNQSSSCLKSKSTIPSYVTSHNCSALENPVCAKSTLPSTVKDSLKVTTNANIKSYSAFPSTSTSCSNTNSTSLILTAIKPFCETRNTSFSTENSTFPCQTSTSVILKKAKLPCETSVAFSSYKNSICSTSSSTLNTTPIIPTTKSCHKNSNCSASSIASISLVKSFPTVSLSTSTLKLSPPRLSVEPYLKLTKVKRTYERCAYDNHIKLKRPRFSVKDNEICFCSCHKKYTKDKFFSHDIKDLINLKLDTDLKIKCLQIDIEEAKKFSADKENKIKQLMKTIQDSEDKMKKLWSDLDNIKQRAIIPAPGTSEHALTFAQLIVDTPKKYSKAEQDIAQHLNFSSSRNYKNMRAIGFNLPHPVTVHRYRELNKINPGLDPNVIENLRKLTSKFKRRQKLCHLIFDEVVIKKSLEYNKPDDVIDGFVDHGDGKRSFSIASKCLFFMIKGTCSNWKYILSYYPVSKDTTKIELKKLLFENIAMAEELGLTVKSLICDQGGPNIGLYNMLGTSFKKPYFMHNNKRIVCLFDYCHLLKNLRNNLFKHGYQTPHGNVRFSVIEKVYERSSANLNYRVCPKLTKKHIYPTFWEKMSVKRAAQVLSKSMAKAIETGTKSGWLKDQAAYATMKFIEEINDIFDELNVKCLKSKNQNNKPIFRNCKKKINRLEKAIHFFLTLEVNCDQIKCVDGFIQTIRGMILLSEIIFEEYEDVQFILLGKLNQDCLENFFSRLRGCLGNSNHPTVKDIKYLTARLFSMKIVGARFQNKGKNCEDDADDDDIDMQMDWDSDFKQEIKEDRCPIDEKMVEEIESCMKGNIHKESRHWFGHYDKSDAVVELQAQRYFAGYTILKNILRKSKCQRCLNSMTKKSLGNDVSEILIEMKNYGKREDLKLVNMNDETFTVFRFQMDCYKDVFRTIAHKTNIKGLLLLSIVKMTNKQFPDYYSDECRDHKLKHLDFALRVLLFKNAKWLAEEFLTDEDEEYRKRQKIKKLNANSPQKKPATRSHTYKVKQKPMKTENVKNHKGSQKAELQRNTTNNETRKTTKEQTAMDINGDIFKRKIIINNNTNKPIKKENLIINKKSKNANLEQNATDNGIHEAENEQLLIKSSCEYL